ncbi:hypothetical protein KIPB_013427, partial [Kipferlia bialata]|eukprot:g13427.t1
MEKTPQQRADVWFAVHRKALYAEMKKRFPNGASLVSFFELYNGMTSNKEMLPSRDVMVAAFCSRYPVRVTGVGKNRVLCVVQAGTASKTTAAKAPPKHLPNLQPKRRTNPPAAAPKVMAYTPLTSNLDTVIQSIAAQGTQGAVPTVGDRLSLTSTFHPVSALPSAAMGGPEGTPPFLSSLSAFMDSGTPPSLLSNPVSAVLGPEGESEPGRGFLGSVSLSLPPPESETLLDMFSVGERERDDSDDSHCTYPGPPPPPTFAPLFLNTRDPFAAVVCGVQNSGKSHTLNSIV